MKNIQLLAIDFQNDFCDPKGALCVAGASEDAERVAKMITKHADKIDNICVTLDSHQLVHIANPICWVDSSGNHPVPFTIIEENDIVGSDAKWRASNPASQEWQVGYVKSLAINKRHPLNIWVPHCLIGTWGWSIYPVFSDALIAWQKLFAEVDFVTKGSNRKTEHYSAVRAEVEDPDDPTTKLNGPFVNSLKLADTILIAGEALSHCVRSTVSDVAGEFSDEEVKKFVFLEDASSPVAGFENLADDFVNEMAAKGMRISRTDTFFS